MKDAFQEFYQGHAHLATTVLVSGVGALMALTAIITKIGAM